jgi:hypothetical protein
MSSTCQYVATIHALKRFEQRLPHLADDDEDRARLMHEDVESGLRAGRVASTFPRQFSGRDYLVERRAPGQECVWTEDLARGYLISDNGRSVTIITVLLREV